MPESIMHEKTANRIAKVMGVKYAPREGAADIKWLECIVEVETPATVSKEKVAELLKHPGEAYIAGTNRKAVYRALKATDGTTVGVMDSRGNIVKASTQGI